MLGVHHGIEHLEGMELMAHYVKNKDLLREVIRARELGKITPELLDMLILMVENYSKRNGGPDWKGSWSNYSYKEDMMSNAYVALSNAALKFDPERSDNPFAYYTQIIKTAFIQVWKHEKKHQVVRDSLLVAHGLDPSHAFIEAQQKELDEAEAQAAGNVDMDIDAGTEEPIIESEEDNPFKFE